MNDEQREERSLVYGFSGEYLVFIREGQARELAEIRAAVNEAKTWGEFQLRVPAAYAEILEYWQENDEEAPSANEPFEDSSIPGWDDGDWPSWPEQDMLDWIPENIQRRYGHVEISVLNGEYLELPSKQTTEIVAALETFGYHCREDQDLVEGACGWIG